MVKYGLIILCILVLSAVKDAAIAEELIEVSGVKEEFLEGNLEDNVGQEQEELDIHNFRDPFLSWLPRAILQEALEQDEKIPIIFEGSQEFEEIMEEEEITLPDFTIQGVIWNTDLPQAIVNDMIVRVGDVIDDAKIVEITKTGITIDYRDRRFYIAARLSIVDSEYKDSD